MQINELLQWGKNELIATSNTALLDAEVLLSHVFREPTTFLMAHNNEKVSLLALLKFKGLIKKRKAGVPLAYLTQNKEFYFLDFYVNKNVLIPRPDTEILVEEAITYINSQSLVNHFQLFDVGTGSGCIPISILKNIQNLTAVAVDLSKKALKVATKNAKKHKVAGRIDFVQSDLLENLPNLSEKNIILTANLPYLPGDYLKTNPNLKYEPSIALYAGKEGLNLYFKLINQLPKIKPKALFFECFDWQVPALQEKLRGYRISTKKMTGKAVCLKAIKSQV